MFGCSCSSLKLGGSFVLKHFFHRRSNVRRRVHYTYSSFLERFHLFSSCSLTAGNNRSSVAHSSSGRRCLAGNKSNDGFGYVRFCKCSSFFFSRSADLANHYDARCFVISLKQPECVHVSSTNYRVAANANR